MSAQSMERIVAQKSLAKSYPVLLYFVLTFVISWSAAFCVAAPKLLRGQRLTAFTGILMFPAMLLGPSLAGIVLVRKVDGELGWRDFLARARRFRIPVRWYAVLLLPPLMILSVLWLLRAAVSPVYAPNHFFLGVLFGIPAGIFEEIGWTGYAFPKMRRSISPSRAALAIGILWGLWHLPVINSEPLRRTERHGSRFS